MKSLKRRFLPALVIALLAIPALVFAKGIGSLTVTGPGIKGELTINDPRRMEELEKAGFFELAILSKPPTGLNMDAGYLLTVSMFIDDDYVPFVEMVYYPTQEGQPSVQGQSLTSSKAPLMSSSWISKSF